MPPKKKPTRAKPVSRVAASRPRGRNQKNRATALIVLVLFLGALYYLVSQKSNADIVRYITASNYTITANGSYWKFGTPSVKTGTPRKNYTAACNGQTSQPGFDFTATVPPTTIRSTGRSSSRKQIISLTPASVNIHSDSGTESRVYISSSPQMTIKADGVRTYTVDRASNNKVIKGEFLGNQSNCKVTFDGFSNIQIKPKADSTGVPTILNVATITPTRY